MLNCLGTKNQPIEILKYERIESYQVSRNNNLINIHRIKRDEVDISSHKIEEVVGTESTDLSVRNLGS